MGKCLSCYKSSSVSGGCVNESSNSLKSKRDKRSSSVITDQDNSMPLVTPSLIHRANGSRKLLTELIATEDTIPSNCVKSSSPISRNRHFAPFFSGKVANADDKPTKRIIPTETKLNTLFDKYKDSDDENLILMDGVERLCSDLNLRPDDFKVLIFAWKLNAEQMYQFTRQEFLNGCKILDAENTAQIQERLTECAVQLENDATAFKNLYKFAFKFGLDRANGQRILPIDMAICLWKLVFTLHPPPILDRWLTFLQSDKTHIRGIPRDTWNMFLNFSETIGDDLSTYNDSEAWPSIFDDFVEYENDRLNQNFVSSSTSCTDLPNSIIEKRKVQSEITAPV